ncbi:MAG TPA: chromosomal replication initiator protein DnaA [Candidatus Limnocylindria bacterium]|nr:chromosomal replication initiator protein DnaA [Candidatus Limnocylindria bacterium]
MSVAAQALWSAAQDSLRGMLKSEIYSLWFAPIRPHTLKGETLTLAVADEFCEMWLKDNYLDLLRSVVSRAAVKPMNISFVVAAPQPAATQPEAEPVVIPEEPAEAVPAAPRPGEPQLNPTYTFSTFVVGNNNEFAHSASVAVAQNPGKAFNPLFLFGGVGLGKTHLLHAIGHHMLTQKKQAKVAYLSCEKFTNEFIDGLQNNTLAKFRRKYRQVDVLLVDDIQFLVGKERIQEEFFHTFNALHENRKQIVLSCDRPANEIQGLEARLISRFEWGQTADVQPPDVETRLAILRNKEQAYGFALPPEILNFLAERIRTNIRRLEGAFTRVAAYAQLTGKPLKIETVETLLREILQEEGRQTITIDTIQKRVAEHYDIRLADMTSKRRPENIAFPRQVAMFLSRQLTESSLSVIGDAFGGRDHGTVLHACRAVKDRMEVDSNVRQAVGYLEKQLIR